MADTPAADTSAPDTPGAGTPTPGAAAGTAACTVERHDMVALVTITRPPHNLLAEPDLRAVADALHEAAGWARAAVVATTGRSFCAGANFRSEEAPDPTDATGFAARTAAFYAQAERIFAAPVPTVAAVHGAAIGAGFGLALACDIRVVSEQAWFQANFVQLGIHPGFALSTTLPRMVGPGRAADLFLTGRRVGGDEALAIGLAQNRSDPGAERDVALSVAGQIAAAAPLAVAATRRTLRAGLAEEAARVMAHELHEQRKLAGTADAVEGVTAVLEKRRPRFEGR